MVYIPTKDIKQPDLHADTLGFTFVWKGHFLRGIYPDAVSIAKRYFDSGFIEEVVKKGLFPETWISDYENEMFGIIIEHEMISPIVYASEWNSAMLKDAASMVIDIAEVGWHYGYNMIDCHKMNVMFRNNKPLYVDLGSFVQREEGSTAWRPYGNFAESYLYILDMWSKGCDQIAKRLMSPGVTMKTDNYLSWKYPILRHFPRLLRGYIKYDNGINRIASLGSDSFSKKNYLYLIKRIVNLFPLISSQKFQRIRRKIRKKRIKVVSNQISLPVINNDSLLNYSSITCINIYDNLLINALQERGHKVISLIENDYYSNFEYFNNKVITSVSYPLLNGSFVVQGKFPEPRLCSDVVLTYCGNGGSGPFYRHNCLVYLKKCIDYSTKGIMYVFLAQRDHALVDTISQYFHINVVSEDGLLIELSHML